MGMFNGAGWSSTGAAFVTPDKAMQEVAWTEAQVKGPGKVKIKLSVPKAAFGKMLHRFEPDGRQAPADQVIEPDEILDITQFMNADGEIEWDAPAGEWTILRMGYQPTGRNMVDSEAFTGAPERIFETYPGGIKAQGDYFMTLGVNRFSFHTWAHDPYGVAPGLGLGTYGSRLDNRNTWWPFAKPWHDYLSRCFFLLQQGEFVGDVQNFQSLVKTVWGDCDGKTRTSNQVGKGEIHWGMPLDLVLAKHGIQPDFSLARQANQPAGTTMYPATDIEFIHRRSGSDEIYFLTNQNPTARPSTAGNGHT